MTKIQNEIREMSNKKLLNSEQKKVLYRLFSSKIDSLASKVRDSSSNDQQRFTDELIRKAKATATIKNLVKTIEKAELDEKKATEKLEALGFSRSSYGSRAGGLDTNYNNAELSKWKNDKQNKLQKIDDLKAKLLSDIYCLPMSAEEMTSYIEEEIAKINKGL